MSRSEVSGKGETDLVECLPDVLLRLLRARGIDDADMEEFLNPSLKNLASPEELPGVIQATGILLSAIAEKKTIVVFGDYDCDGVCATAILVKVLSALMSNEQDASGRVAPFIPERLTEGYGMSDASVSRLLEEIPDVGLVITVDNGINSIKQVADLKARGVSVVVTDHHLPSYARVADGAQGEMLLPEAEVVVNPKVAAPPHLQNLCGAGVAFFLANSLVAEAKERGLYEGPKIGGPLLVLAGLATVTDIMPVLGQNRILVAEALKNFRMCAPLGLRELHFRAARNARGELTSRDFGFMLGPRINAAGRLASGMDALDLVLETNRERVREYAIRIDLNNAERKTIEQRMTDEALAKVVPNAAAQVIDLPDGHPGVAGIVAARVMERLGETVPVCVLAGGHGSARAPVGINIRDAFVACDEVLERYGGHAAAGGFSVKDGQVDHFRELLAAYCEKFQTTDMRPGKPTDLWLDPADVTLELAEALVRLEPFGEGNPEPVFGLRRVLLQDVRPMGAEGRHLSAMVGVPDSRVSANRLRALWWNHGGLVEELREKGACPHDLRFSLSISDFGERHAELRLVSID